MKKPVRFYLIAVTLLLVMSQVNAQVSVTATAGTTGPTAYTTVNAAFAAINAGTHQGDVTIAVTGNTTEPTTSVPLLKSASPSSYTSILIIPSGGDWTINSGASPTASRGVLEFFGADNVTIDGDPASTGTRHLSIVVATTSNAGTAAIRLASTSTTGADGADNCIIKNCNITGGRNSATSTTTSYGVVMSTSTSISSGAYNSLNTRIENNLITRCYHGVYAPGASGYPNTGTKILNNTIGSATSALNIGSRGILITYSSTTAGANSALISGNDIRVGTYETTGYGATIAGIEIGTVNAGCTVTRNNIHDINQPSSSGYGAHGIYITGSASNASIDINNNFIRDCKMAAYQSSATSTFIPTGIFFTAGATLVKINYNTISMGQQLSANTTYSSFCVNSSVSGVTIAEFQNNILVNTHNSSAAYGLYTAATGNISGGAVDYNDYYCPNGKVGYYNAAARTTLGDWQSATSKDVHSISVLPGFQSATNLHIDLGATAVNNLGTPVAGITVDFDGDTRSATTPDIGADEYTPLVCVGAAGGTIAPATANSCAGLTYTMSTSGSEIGAGVSYQWEVSTVGGGVDFSDVTGGAGANTTSYTTAAMTTGVYYYRLRVTCSFGPITGYSNELTMTVNTPPVVTVSPETASFCSPGGTPVTLTAGGANTYSWSPSAGLNTTTGPEVLASPSANTTYTVTGTDGNNCSASATATITVAAAVAMNSVTATPPSVCSGGSTVLLASASLPAPAAYCTAGATSTSFEKISNVTLNTINNSSTATAGYENFTALSTTLAVGTPYSFSVGISSPYSSDIVYIWVDLNMDGIFDNPGEKLFEGSGAVSPVTGSITIPGGTNNGTTRMRVRMQDNSSGPNTTPCGTSTYGQVEDYTLIFTGGTEPLSFAWTESPESGTLVSTSGNPVDANNILTDQTYYVTATSSSGCSASGSVLVTLGVPVACTDITTSPACDGTDFTLTANTTGGGGTLSYLWSDGTTNTLPDAQTITANLPAGTYTYSVTVTDACGTFCEMSQSISVHALPGGVAAGPANAFTYSPLVYTATGYETGSTFQWEYSPTSCETGFITLTGATADEQTLNAISAGTFYIRCVVTGPTGCISVTNCVTTVVTVAGDNVCGALPLTFGVNGPFTNQGATIETGEAQPPTTSCSGQSSWCGVPNGTINNTVWFTFIAPPSGRVSIHFYPANWDSQIALWSAASCNDLLSGAGVLMAANDDSAGSPFNAWIAPICLTPGETYYVQTDAYGTGYNNNFGILLKDEGNQPPVISNCPSNFNFPVNAAGCTANVTWTAPTASDPDNCATLDFSSTHNPGDNFPLGVTTVTYTANDGINPPVTCSFDVTVTTAIDAVISGDLTICDESANVLDAGAGYASYLWSTMETTQTISVSTATTVSVVVTDIYGCTDNAEVTTSMVPLPEVPGSITTSGITPFTFDLSWTFTGGPVPDYYYIEVATDNLFTSPVAGSPFAVSYPATTFTVPGLTGSNTYFYRMSAGNECYSHYSDAGSITTICPPAAAPFVEDFEDGGFAPACWANDAVSGSFVWQGSTAASSGGVGHGSALANFYNQAAGVYELKTVPFDMSALTDPTLKFNYAYATYVVELDELSVYYSTDYGKTWTLLLLMDGGPTGLLNTAGATEDPFVPTPSQWCTQALPLLPGTNMIKFTATSAYGNNLYLDNITVSDPAATALTLQDISVTGTVGYFATETITTAGPGSYFLVNAGASAVMYAGESILLREGTTVAGGGYLYAAIHADNYCNMGKPVITDAENTNQSTERAAFSLFPNPTTGNFTLVLKGDRKFEDVAVEILSMRGEKVLTDRLAGDRQREFGVAALPAGVYFVKIQADGYVETIKLVKTR